MKKRFSISLQILFFLIIIAFIPVAAMMALKTYEKQQLVMLENSNVQQAAIVASGLYGDTLDSQKAFDILKNMEGRFDARIRVIGTDKNLIADSALITNETDFEKQNELIKEQKKINNEESSEKKKSSQKKASETFIYNVFSYPVRFYRKYLSSPSRFMYDSADYYAQKNVFDGEEVLAALKGSYGATTRISSGGQVSVTIYSALPVKGPEGITGVVLVSRSTYRILQNIYDLRLDLAKVFVWSLLAVIAVSIFLTLRISRPLKLLSKQALKSSDKNGRVLSTEFTGSKRHDEIGDLSRSFTVLLTKLNKRIQFSESFSSDISHEFKNPLAAIRSSAELLEDTDLTAEERAEFIKAIKEETSHLQLLLNGVRSISRIDSDTENNEQLEELELVEFTKNIITRTERVYPETQITLESNREKIMYGIKPDYFDRLMENLIQNAAGFGTKVKVTLVQNEKLTITVEDNGKGVSEEEKEKIFNRFYSSRKDKSTQHTGLGLSIVKSIVEQMNAGISVEKSKALGGASFSVEL